MDKSSSGLDIAWGEWIKMHIKLSILMNVGQLS